MMTLVLTENPTKDHTARRSPYELYLLNPGYSGSFKYKKVPDVDGYDRTRSVSLKLQQMDALRSDFCAFYNLKRCAREDKTGRLVLVVNL